MTTIEVSARTRDRLKTQARAAHCSLGAYVDRLAELADRIKRLESLRDAVATTSPEDMSTYQADTEEWETTELTDATRGTR